MENRAAVLIQQYLEMFGRVIVRCYVFPEIQRNEMMLFLNSLRIMLNRSNQRPMYLWQHDLSCHQYRVILLTSAYFHTAESFEVHAVISRLWSNRSASGFQCVSSELIDPANLSIIQPRLNEFLHLSAPGVFPWHQHSFGSSRFFISSR